MRDLNTAQRRVSEARTDLGRTVEQAQEVVRAQRDEMIDAIWKEVDDGQHDDQIPTSEFIDLRGLTRIARRTLSSKNQFIQDLTDYSLQLTAYVIDAAERRITRS